MISVAMMQALMPQLIIAFGLVLSLLLVAWQRSQRLIQLFTIVIFIAALIANIQLFPIETIKVTSLLKVDNYSVFTFVLIGFSGVVVTLLSGKYLKKHMEVHDEYYLLLQLVILGASILIVSDHFASLFLGFELLSIALVGLVGYVREEKYAVETGFKYLILSATASSFMLLGIAFIYSQTGDLSFISHTGLPHKSTVLSIGTVLFFVGIAFKLSLVPFHFWTPDVYQGSSTPVTMLLATVSKVAMFTVLMKFWFSWYLYAGSLAYEQSNVIQLLSAVAILSMVFGNALALMQKNVKRLLGYSSIAHMGYLLIIFMVTSNQSVNFAWQSALFYLAGYVIANLSIFAAVIIYSQQLNVEASQEELTISHWQGLFWRNKTLASLVIVAVLSLAGIPLTMGFIGKFYLLSFATNAELWGLITALIIGSGIGLFYYLRIIFALFSVEPDQNSITAKEKQAFELPLLTHLFVAVFAIVGVFLGVFPNILTHLITLL